jgi:hypothetical protein
MPISMAMGVPKDGAQVYFIPYYEKNDDHIILLI